MIPDKARSTGRKSIYGFDKIKIDGYIALSEESIHRATSAAYLYGKANNKTFVRRTVNGERRIYRSS